MNSHKKARKAQKIIFLFVSFVLFYGYFFFKFALAFS